MSFKPVRVKSRGGLQMLDPQTGVVYKPAQPGPAGGLNNSLRLTNRLKLNTEKTELLWVGSRHSLSQQGCCLPELHLGPDIIAARDHVRLLGVTLSSK